MFYETTSLSNPRLKILQKEKIASLNCANTGKKMPWFQDSKFQIPCFTHSIPRPDFPTGYCPVHGPRGTYGVNVQMSLYGNDSNVLPFTSQTGIACRQYDFWSRHEIKGPFSIRTQNSQVCMCCWMIWNFYSLYSNICKKFVLSLLLS